MTLALSEALRVVVCGDEPILREGIISLISKDDGLAVVGQACDVHSAAEQVIALRPDVLLLDIPLAGLSAGRVLIQLQRTALNSPATKTILLADDLSQFQALEALDLGARGILSKHAASGLLAKAIHCVADDQYWVKRELFVQWIQERGSADNSHHLSDRERVILDEVLAGSSNRAIGAACGIAESTAQRHLANIYKKLGVSGRRELTLYATKHKI